MVEDGIRHTEQEQREQHPRAEMARAAHARRARVAAVGRDVASAPQEHKQKQQKGKHARLTADL